jgi:hypothetical protein
MYNKVHMWMQFANAEQYQHMCLVKCSNSVVKEVADYLTNPRKHVAGDGVFGSGIRRNGTGRFRP